MDILGLTTTEAIRATIGADINNSEYVDQDFTDFSIADELKAALLEWLSDYQTLIDAQAGSPTEVEQNSFLFLKLYAKYFCAHTMLRSQDRALAVEISDGNNKVSRSDDRKEREAKLKHFSQMARTFQNLVKTTYLSETPSVATMMSAATPDYDPITG